MKVVVVGYTNRDSEAYPVCLDSVFEVTGRCLNTFETFLDHRRHDWYPYTDHNIPKKTDVLINLYSRKHKMPRHCLAITASTVINPRTSHRYIREPEECFKLLNKLGIDHPRSVSASVTPAVMWSPGGSRELVMFPGRERRHGAGVIRTEPCPSSRRVRVAGHL